MFILFYIKILDHNSRVSWWSFTIPLPMETGMNALRRSYKIYESTLNYVSTLSVKKSKTT